MRVKRNLLALLLSIFAGINAFAQEIPHDTYVSLRVFSIIGEEIAELAGKEFPSGKHTLEYDTRNLSKGIYFYTIKVDNFSTSRRMII